MSKIIFGLRLLVQISLFFPTVAMAQQTSAANDWTTYGYDQERSGWNRGETALGKNNVAGLKLLWSAQVSTLPKDVVLSTLTAPVVSGGVLTPEGRKNLVFLVGADDTLFALDADSGKVVWQKSYPNLLTPVRKATWICSNTTQVTPVIDKQKGVIYFLMSDGKLRGANLGDGSERLAPTQFISPFSRAWSLNLIDDVIYTQNARGCGDVQPDGEIAAAAVPITIQSGTGAGKTEKVEPGAVSAMNISDLTHPVVTRFYTSGGRQSGPWGRGGVAKTPKGLVTQTADGTFDPASGDWGDSVIELAPHATRLVDSFTPSNQKFLRAHDLDLGSGSAVVFPFDDKTLVSSSSKEGVLYLLDANDLGGGLPDHSSFIFRSQQLGNDAATGTRPAQGMWGSLATYRTPDGRRFVYYPMWGPPSTKAPPFQHSYGPIPNGSIMAFQVVKDGGKVTAEPAWTSINMTVPDSPIVANGVVYAVQTGEQTQLYPPSQPGQKLDPATNGATFRATPVSNLVLYALDAETGKVLYSSKKLISNWVHFNEPVVALGKVFVVSHDSHVYAFGLK